MDTRLSFKSLWIASVLGVIAICGAAHAAGGDSHLQVGTAAPNFILLSQEEKPVALSDYKGKWVVLYFYPKDMSTGCTIEAHNFQRDLPRYDALNTVILGVSLDTVESHKTFCTKDSLTFKLLADPDHKVIDAYGVHITNFGIMKAAARDTYLISPSGKVAKVWTGVKASTHSEEVLADLATEKK